MFIHIIGLFALDVKNLLSIESWLYASLSSFSIFIFGLHFINIPFLPESHSSIIAFLLHSFQNFIIETF